MIVQVCTNSFQSALNTEEADADRIELCNELALENITPNFGQLKKVNSKKHFDLNMQSVSSLFILQQLIRQIHA
ncbi:copper homeostasis protein CutC [Flavobacteriaceae bacterium]|jgi:copper homeostasis protein|nr:copper homeostasis protein CutC [Flavobacteriaceae bacterium]